MKSGSDSAASPIRGAPYKNQAGSQKKTSPGSAGTRRVLFCESDLNNNNKNNNNTYYSAVRGACGEVSLRSRDDELKPSFPSDNSTIY